MATPVKMPELGESITEGTITRWIKQEGDRVEADEPLFEVSTDKVDTEVPSPVAGVLKTIKVQADETVEVGAELAIIDEGPAGEATEEGAEEEPEAEAEAEAAGGEQEAEEAAQPDEGSEEAGTEEQREAAAAADGGEAEAEEAEAEEEPAERPKAGASGDGKTTTVTMPELGESITEGTITRWLKQEGDQVEADEPLFEVSTDKVDTEVPSPVAGVLQSIKVQADETVEVGAELAVIGGGGDGGAEAPAAQEEQAGKEQAKEEDGRGRHGAEAEEAAEAEPEPEAKPAAKAKPKDRTRTRRRPGPRATARAAAGGVAAGAPAGPRARRRPEPGPGQRSGAGCAARTSRPTCSSAASSRRRGVGEARPRARARGKAAAAPAAPPRVAVPLAKGLREEVVPATRLRKVIAERMVASLQTSAQLTSAVEIDMTRVMRLRERAKDEFKAREGVSLSPLPFAVLALDRGHQGVPDGQLGHGRGRQPARLPGRAPGRGRRHPQGPVRAGGQARRVPEPGRPGQGHRRRGQAHPRRQDRPDELAGSTISLTNTGSRGAVWDTPIINQPNAAIFATPAIVKRPVVVDDPDLGEVVAVRHVMYGILTYDHRIIDGADAARFLVKVKEVLEAADFEGDLGLERE
jgi:2-oxoglutarate dehydrogenase E2 component (dihydrolipoamide succinyltransferase)